MDKERMRALHAIIDEHTDTELSPKEALRRVAKVAYIEFPDLTVEELSAALAAHAEELRIQEQEELDEVKALMRVEELIQKAETRSGRKGLTTEMALKYLAENGDEEAKAMLEQFSMSDYVAFVQDVEAAAAADSHWHTDGKNYWCDAGAEETTIFALVETYRRRQDRTF